MAGAKETSNTPQRGGRASKGRRTRGPVAAGGNNGLAGKENTLAHNNTGKRSQKGKSRGRGRDNIVRPEPADRDSRAGKTSRSGYRPLPGTSRVSSSEAPASDELSAAQMQVFLEAGLAMIDESPDTRRTFIESLATESGLRKVRQIVETDFAISYSVLKPMFDPHCILFFQLVSHNEVLSSLILEKAVGTIYNVIYGPGGRRAIGFFTKVTDYLTQFKSDGRSQAVVQHVATPSEVLSLVSRVLLGTLTLNHEAAIQVDLKKIADRLYDCCHANNADARAGDDNLQLAYENILKIQEIFSMGDSIPMPQKPDQVQKIKSNQQNSTRYIVDLPGELSDHGPRHDNDKTAISDIQILPTNSEILNADRPEFLPARCATGSANMHHEWGIRRLLDSQFRLLREDTSGVLREGIRLIIHAWELIVHGTDWRLKRKFLRDKMPTPVRVYSGVEIRQIKSEQFKGIEVNLEFDQLPRLKNVSPAKRKQWWFDSKALKKGPTLLALLDAEDVDDTSAIYFLVSKRETSYVDKDKQGSVTGDRVSDVVSDGNRAMVTLGLVGPPNPPDLERLVLFSRSKPFPRPLILVEFPAIPYNSFEGILRCLQVLHQNPARMPFTAWLAPSTDNHELCEALKGGSTDAGSISIQPPAYFHKDLLLDLSCLPGQGDIEDASQILSMSLSHDPRMLSADLSRATDLDEGQANAFIWALRRKIALIQGPPGTGKSYVGLQLARCLLHNKDVLDLGPILCVCYTAHALDQFLDGLLRSSVTNIIRIGPRSASPHIERLSLDMRKQEPGPRVKGLPRLKDESRVKLLSISSRIDELLKQAQSGCHSLVLGILKKRFPAQASRITSESPGETDTNALQAWVSGDAPGDWSEANIERSIDRLLQEDVWTLKASERTRLLNYWQEAALAEISQQVLTLLETHSAEKERYTSAFSLSDVQRLNNCQVVGVTTTQLANNAELLRNLNAKVLICEEAAEVLESHVLTALIPSIQHAILIGDHLQLRPRISNLRLSMDYERENPKYNLDESLFERLANSRFGESTSSGTGGQNQQEYSFPVMQLSHQRRMHPSISELVRETLYPKLQDHPTMTSYPLVPGIARRLFWLDHCNVEDPTDPTEPMQSKTNTWEIGMVTALVRHLCQQGKYGPGEIAVLTPYVGQLRMLRNVLEKEMTIIISETDSDALDESEGLQVSGPCMNEHGKWCGKQRAPQKGSLLDAIRLATVDNFQGEEASVVIVSLVRSNRSRNCGFLKMPNRINVLLSALSAQPLCKDLQRIVPSMRRDMRMGLNIPCDLRCKKKLTSCGHQCPGLCGERCPDSRSCRICGGPDILEQNVDLIELKAYKDINVDEDPLVFLSCGHFYTASSLDGIMGMSEHYEVESSTGRILGPRLNHRLFDSGRPKGCPQCRAPLRDIDRYNRIIKQAFLDEATKKFATHASIKFGHLVEEVEGYEKDIIGEKSKFVSDWYQETVETRSADDVRRSVDVYRGRGNRLLNKIKEFTKSVAKSEQPFGRVSEMLASVAARKTGTPATPFQYNESDIQTGFQSRGHVLALRLTWVLFWNYDSIYSNKRIDPRIKVTLAQVVAKQIGGLLSQCEALTKYCQEAKFLQQEVETRTYHVLFSVLSLSNREARGNAVSGTTEAKIREKALKELEACDAICLRHSKILWYLREDIDKARRLVNGGTFYSCVTSEERRQVYQAMAAQFNGTGHWYYCENNHPFAVGECGMPMEESRCPQCEAPVGGLNHEFAQGIRRADDMDVEFGGSLSLEAHADL
ncbi:hypothetical protein CBS147482_8117 [Aspergillus niger]|nr:hypothetical protein CBS147322_9125 [Aspergillus niger]KAI2966160.1 hypothetical protein CBS147324_7592 [Aspergillus niger]KAI2995829.1 hypothetical protein CBS147482_8117 [Aspergillus niger]KAI3055199.1 hypothetical protein CBS147352_3098 [Aspergillus niger]